MSIDNKTSDKVSMKEIAVIVECPVCQELPKSSFVQCRNGHIGCYSCFSRLQICPVCRVVMNHKARRISVARMISVERLGEMLSELRHVETSSILLDNEKISGFFKCNSCEFVPTRKPIYQCSKGHWFCKKCALEWQSCDVCEKPNTYYSKDLFFRSIFSEKILSKFMKNCRFASYGCKEKIIELSEHEKDCIYREFRCIMGPCPVKAYATIYNYLDHVKEKHSDQIKNLKEDEVKGGHFYLPQVKEDEEYFGDKWTILLFKFSDNHYFVMYCNVYYSKKVCYFMMNYIGHPIEAEKFRFKLKLFREGFENVIEVIRPVALADMHFVGIERLPEDSHFVFSLNFGEIVRKWYNVPQKLAISWEGSVYKEDP